MPLPGRSILLAAAVAGAALGAGPAIGAKHHRTRLLALKAGGRGHVPARTGRAPLTGTQPITGPGATTPITTGTVPTTTIPTCPTAVGVSEWEYHTVPSRTSLCVGTITMELRNTGADPHNLEVRNVDTGTVVATWADAKPRAVVAKPVTLTAGTYRLYCTLPDHDALGMHAVITVG